MATVLQFYATAALVFGLWSLSLEPPKLQGKPLRFGRIYLALFYSLLWWVVVLLAVIPPWWIEAREKDDGAG